MSAEVNFALGQRWLSNTETELGLGTIVSVEGRSVHILFPATGESRVYAANSAPLTRITFEEGDTVTHHEGWSMQVSAVTQVEGLNIYHGVSPEGGESIDMPETALDHNFQLNDPIQRLLNGQVDEPKWFDLRRQCLNFQHQHATSPLLGFVGARVDLIPHQLHIAQEVGRRYAPRVLLADEVGLGKTIEAALIIHQQLLTNRAQRVLILVPSSLVHQWLVEMLRRVNLAFAIFDEERCQAMEGESGNPFEAEQLVLCSLDFLTHNSKYFQQAVDAGWDLMVVDEAHHLIWSEGQASQEYQVVESLANETKGVLLLTATPDQLGHESHFARLRLLDAARFHHYQSFVEEEQGYSQLAQAIKPLLSGDVIEQTAIDAIREFADPQMTDGLANADQSQKDQLINQLLDRHGTGRVLFRNSRAGVSGFPSRRLFQYPLAMPAPYAELLATEHELQLHLTPERHASFVDSWTDFDPRVEWFIQHLQQLKGVKVLTICANAATALQLSETLRVKSGIRSTVFHEGMSIVERDKAANYFAQSEDGAQVLICSEIGSEGRNFQFAHHLVLFDLPLVPDLLEQRIGRLDRIGQTEDVHIHVPHFQHSGQQVLLNWYHQGLNAFEQTCPTGTNVYAQTAEELHTAILAPQDIDSVNQLVSQTHLLHTDLRTRLEQGRDRLLEMNSSGKGKVEHLLADILESEQSPTLERFMTRLFDALGIVQEEKDDYCYLLRPGESMHNHLPGLDEEGMTVTYERETATQLEQVHFLSWDHPMIHHAMDMITTDTLGKCAIAMNIDKSLPPGTFWLECLFVLSGKGHRELQLNRFLPPTPLHICLDAQGNLTDKAFIGLQAVQQKMATQLVNALGTHIEKGLQKATELAQTQADQLRQQCLQQTQALLGNELKRLMALREHNPAIREEELTHIASQLEGLTDAIEHSDVHLEGLRLVVNNH